MIFRFRDELREGNDVESALVETMTHAGRSVIVSGTTVAVGLLAMLALLTLKVRPLFWAFVVAFNIVGMADLLLDYFHAMRAGLPAIAGTLGAAYAIPVIYVPLLMITHVASFYLLLRAPRD